MCGCTKISGMARKKRRKSTGRRKSYRRRSRVGALPQNVAGTVLSYGVGVPIGVVASDFVSDKITVKPALKAVTQAVLGVATIFLNGKSVKIPILDAIGGGMIAGGGMTAIKELASITDAAVAGLESPAPSYSMSGLDNPPPVNSFLGATTSGGNTLRVRVR